LFSGYLSVSAQVKVLPVIPGKTNPAIQQVHSPHLAVYDPRVHSKGKLILMFVGTGGSAARLRGMDSIFATMGYHAISLEYENNVITTACSQSKDSACFNYFRKEIITGTPVSSKVKVDSVDSILNRFRKLLRYLVKNDPEGGWGRFVKHGKPRWNRIITAGHSQGAGHSAYLGKMFKVSRVLVFSGPQDYLDVFHKPAGWQSRKSATPPDRYYAFLHMKDPFNIKHQLANCDALMQKSKPDSVMVHPGVPVKGHHHILVTDIPTKAPHGSTIQPEFKNVWRYMLTGK
jgi:hypothetical protein